MIKSGITDIENIDFTMLSKDEMNSMQKSCWYALDRIQAESERRDSERNDLKSYLIDDRLYYAEAVLEGKFFINPALPKRFYDYKSKTLIEIHRWRARPYIDFYDSEYTVYCFDSVEDWERPSSWGCFSTLDEAMSCISERITDPAWKRM